MKIETTVKVSGGSYGDQTLVHVQDMTALVELNDADSKALTAAQAAELRDLAEAKVRTIAKEVGRQLDIAHEQARARERSLNN